MDSEEQGRQHHLHATIAVDAALDTLGVLVVLGKGALTACFKTLDPRRRLPTQVRLAAEGRR